MPKRPKRLDTHHLCWYRKAWASGYAHQIREHWYMKVDVPKDGLHAYIHHNLESIPVPSTKALKRAYDILMALEFAGALFSDDDIERRLQIALLMFEEASATHRALKRQLYLVHNYRPP